jgi:hypothetical protein
MKSVIMIAHGFAPEGNAGTYRPLRFVRHLPSMGWQPTVITQDTDFYERYDPGLLGQVPKEIEVIRIRNRDPWQAFQSRRARGTQERILSSSAETVARIQSAHQNPVRSSIREVLHRLETWCYHPDIAMGWIRPAVKAVCDLARISRPDTVWATGGPISSFIVAQRVSYRVGIPYVLDFRDALTFTPCKFEEQRPQWARRLDRRSISRLLSGAQAVVFRYHTEAECYFRACRDALEPSKIHIIPNGFEGEIDEFEPKDGEKLEILYTGALTDYRYDTLLDALRFLKQSCPDLTKRLHFHFVGEGTEALEVDAAKLGLTDIITTSGPVPHESIRHLSREAHAFLILGRPPTKPGYELFAGAKLFGYLKAGTPIMGVLPNDETRKILLRVGVTTVADVDSRSEIVTVLRRLLDGWSQGKLSSLLPKPSECQAYSAKRQTQDLVRALEGTAALEPFVPGTVEVPPSLREEING